MFEEDFTDRELILVHEINTQSDRGAAIIGVAWVEEAVEAAIKSFLVDDKKSSDRLFRVSGPISSFSAKIDLARLLGICSKAIASDLHSLREIRNEFAHAVVTKDIEMLSFGSQHIKDKSLALNCVKHESHTNPRQAFIRACAILNSDFYKHQFFGCKVSDGGQVIAQIEPVA